MERIVILAPNAFNYIENKTGNMLLRYRPKEVVAVIDPEKAGQTAEQVIGWGGNIPCVASFNETISYSPTQLVIGAAPQGGILKDNYRNEIKDALLAKCQIISGMHVFLKDDNEIFNLAKKMNVTISDLRRSPNHLIFPRGLGKIENSLSCLLLDPIVIPGK